MVPNILPARMICLNRPRQQGIFPCWRGGLVSIFLAGEIEAVLASGEYPLSPANVSSTLIRSDFPRTDGKHSGGHQHAQGVPESIPHGLR